MTTRLFYDKDCSLEPLKGKNIVFIGYGNQGRAQALNIRDTIKAEVIEPSPKIIIANQKDDYATRVAEDGFESTRDWSQAAVEADILFLLVPDQVQPKLFNEKLVATLKPSAVIVVASGYNIFYNHLKIPRDNDVVMVAPRMIGTSVRSLYESGKGFPCFVSVEQDGTGNAWPTALALCRAIGATKRGVIESSAREETLMDLFAEQALWPSIIAAFTESYRVLKELGCSDEALVHELWLSKEPAEVFEKCAEDGFIKQLIHHSSVSQYGQLKGSMELEKSGLRREFLRVANDRILNGAFAKEFMALDSDGPGVQATLDDLYEKANKSELARGESEVRQRLGLKSI